MSGHKPSLSETLKRDSETPETAPAIPPFAVWMCRPHTVDTEPGLQGHSHLLLE